MCSAIGSLTNPTLHTSTWTGLHHIWRVDPNVQAKHQRHTDRLHLYKCIQYIVYSSDIKTTMQILSLSPFYMYYVVQSKNCHCKVEGSALFLPLTRSFIRQEFSLFSIPSIFSLCLFFIKLSGRFQSDNADGSSKLAMSAFSFTSKTALRVKLGCLIDHVLRENGEISDGS